MYTYDPRKVMVQFGNQQITGFSSDSIINITPNGEGYQKYVGADGTADRAKDPDHTFNVEISLASTSKSNDYLSQMHNADNNGDNNAGVQPLLIKDLSGSLLFFASEGYVVNFPETGRGRQIGEVTWTIATGQVEAPVMGGNDA